MGASLTFGRHIILTESVRPIADGLNEQLNDPSSGNEVQGSQASYDYSAWIPENFDEILAAIQAKFDMGSKSLRYSTTAGASSTPIPCFSH